MQLPPWRTRRNRFKEALQDGVPVAMWITTPWDGALAVLGAAGADAAFIDLEHVSYDVDVAERLIVAAEAAGISPLVRPSGIEPAVVSRLLDAGAHGIVFPQVQDRQDAELAVACTRFRPKGVRGWGGAHTRFALWQGGYAGDVLTAASGEAGVYSDKYVRTAEEFPAVILLIESARGVEQSHEILAVPGVDGVVFGWGDFAVECGFDKVACSNAAEMIRSAAERRGIGVAVSPDGPFVPGCFVLAGVDSLLMSRALGGAIESAHAAIGRSATSDPHI